VPASGPSRRRRRGADPADLREQLRRFALSLPEAVEDTPWEEDRVAKVRGKVFVFLGSDTEPTGITLKLPGSQQLALSLSGVTPAGYGLGRSGWVSIELGKRGGPPLDLLLDWVEESYRAVAPKRLSARLDAGVAAD
jgi:predicted DNA-binding protein (MmcQ/YjbR family)